MSISFNWEQSITYERKGLLSDLLTHITDFTVTLVGTDAYFIGPLVGDTNTTIATFNLVSEEWRIIAAQEATTLPLQSRHTTCLYNDKLYCIAGGNTTSYFTIHEAAVELWTFDVVDGGWTQAVMGGRPPMRNPNLGPWKDQYVMEMLKNMLVTYRVHRSAHKLLGHASSLVVLKLDESDNIWAEPLQKGACPSPRLRMCSCSTDDAMYVYGGVFNQSPLGGLYQVTVLGGAFYWSQLREAGFSKREVVNCSIVAYDGRIFVFGGKNERGGKLSECGYYDCREHAWKQVDSGGNGAHAEHQAIVTEDSVMYFGGSLLNFPGMLRLTVERT